MNRERSREERLSSWLEAWIEARESGSHLDAAAFCTEEDLRTEFCALVAEEEGLDFLGDDLREQREGPTSDPLIGRVIEGRLRVDRLLGRGGMGAVYAARHLTLDRDIALKFLGELRFGRREAHERFEREAKALARLRHSAIVPVLDSGELEGRPWFAMELLRGCDLARWMRNLENTTVPAADATYAAWRNASGIEAAPQTRSARWQRPFFEFIAALGADVARGLEVAHAAQVVHRDVKPSNLWLDADGHACLADFGLARLGDEATLTRDDVPLGTPAYMAPEQLGRSPELLDGRADIYGLGATLYHLLTRRLPFEGGSAEVLTRLKYEDPPEPRALCAAIPRDLEAIVLRAMEKRPGDRYASAQEFAADLDAFIDRREVRARRSNVIKRTWRKLARRPARALAILGFAIASVAAYVAYAHATQVAEQDRKESIAARRASLPALFTLEHDPRSNWMRPYRDPIEIGASLDAILAFAPEDRITRWFRANFRSQQGQIEEAQFDLDHLASHGNATPLMSSLSSILLAPLESSRFELPRFESLPPPQSGLDHFLAGYVALRYRQFAVALEAFDRAYAAEVQAGTTGLWSLRDVRSIAALGALDSARALEDAYAVEGALGYSTARTQHVIGAALYLQGADDKAEMALRRSLELQPCGHAPHHHLGVLFARRGQIEEAESHLREALRLRPDVWNTRSEIARLQRERGQFEAARKTLEGRPLADTAGFEPRVVIAQFNLEVEAWRAAADRAADEEAAICLQRALECRDTLRAEKKLGFVDAQKLAVGETRLQWLRSEIDAQQAYDRYLHLLNREETFLATRPRSEHAFLRDPYLRENLARAAQATQRRTEAELFLRQALSLETCPSKVYGLLVEVLIENKKLAEAVREWIQNPERFRHDTRLPAWIERMRTELSEAERASLWPRLVAHGLVADEQSPQELANTPSPSSQKVDK